jgi:5-methylcytosine-specific restriction endonuclease McrA
MRFCTSESCQKKHYSKGYCKSHYRKFINNDHKKRWEKIRNDPIRYRAYLDNKKKYDDKYRSTHKIKSKLWKELSPEQKRRSSISAIEYKRRNPEEAKKWDKQAKDKRLFGGLREIVIQRDRERCCQCGMTRQQHYEKYHRDITVDHKNRKGRGVKKDEQDNTLENLWTLCISCHMKKDGGLNALRKKKGSD